MGRTGLGLEITRHFGLADGYHGNNFSSDYYGYAPIPEAFFQKLMKTDLREDFVDGCSYLLCK
jgi:hypothetical protein